MQLGGTLRRSTAWGGRRVWSALAVVAVTTGAVGVFVPLGPATAGGATVACSSSWSRESPATSSGLHLLTGGDAVAGGGVFAVGYSIAGGLDTTQPFAERWTGSGWVVAPTQSVTPKDTELNAVSMFGGSDGWTVGWSSANGWLKYQTLAEHWDGAAWTSVTTPNPSAGNNLLLGVDELTATDTWAVGYSDGPAGARQTLAEQWNGTAWSIVPTPSVGSGDNVLLSVAGRSADDIWAVGYTATTLGIETLIEHYDGASWTVAASPSGGPADNVLTGVSGSGPRDVWAVGYETTSSGLYHALVEHWDGVEWTVTPLPTMADSVDVLRSVAAESSSNAWAVGSYLGSTGKKYYGFSLHWDGSTWSLVSMPSEASDSQLRAVTHVPGSNRWWAVGESSQQPLALDICPSGAPATPVAPTRQSDPADRPVVSVGPDDRGRSTPTTWTPRRTDSTPEPVVAVDEGPAAGLPQHSNTIAAAVADFGNGLPDIFYAGETGDGGLYVNSGSGRFTVTDQQEFPPADRRSCTTGDVLGNGSTDIFCTVGAENGNQMKTDDLYIEGPGMTFTDQAAAYGVVDPFARGGATTFVPTPNGPPDLFVGANSVRSDGLPSPNRFYVNNGHGFEDAPQYGIDQSVGAGCATTSDYTGDGLTDLLICSQTGPRLYENTGSGFTDVTQSAGLPSGVAADAIFADLNGDGRPDIVLVTLTQLLVYLQNPDHTFSLSYSCPLKGGVGVAAGDVNGDGALDLYVVQGSAGKISNEPDLMLINNGLGTDFTSIPIPETSMGVGSGAFPIDFENNGLTDFLVLNGGLIARPGPSQLISFFPAAAPEITSADTAPFVLGTPGTFTVTTTGSPTMSISESGVLPPGLTLTDNDDGTATIAGTATSSGSYPITVTASNGVAPDATQALTIDVS
jgi:hypothetical protein